MKLGVLVLSLLSFTAGSTGVTGQAPQTAQAPVSAESKAILEKLQGDWMITWFNDQQLPAEAEAYLVFKGDKYEQWAQNEVQERGTLTIDANAKPMKMDMAITEGSDAGQLQLGVFDLTADTLTIAVASPGGTVRPASLTQGEIYAVLKKVK